VADDNGNGKVKNAVQDEKIDRLITDVGEIKTSLNKFIDGTIDVRMHCQKEFGVIGTHIKILWALVSAISIGSAIAIVRAVISTFTT